MSEDQNEDQRSEAHKRKIGKDIQEYIACLLAQYFPSPKYTIWSNDSNGEDIHISDGNGTFIKAEVKSAIELFIHTWRNRKTNVIKKHVRRGMFNIFDYEMNCDFFVFVIRFVDSDLKWNGDIEILYAKTEDVKNYAENKWYPKKYKDTYRSYNLNIEKLPKVNVTLDFEKIKQNLEVLD